MLGHPGRSSGCAAEHLFVGFCDLSAQFSQVNSAIFGGICPTSPVQSYVSDPKFNATLRLETSVDQKSRM